MTDQQPLITRTDFVFLPITSFEKAEDFHSGVLVPGLECSKRYDNGLGGEFETGSLTIQVVDVAKIGREFEPSKGAIGLHVEDVESAAPRPSRAGLHSSARRWTAASATRRIPGSGRQRPDPSPPLRTAWDEAGRRLSPADCRRLAERGRPDSA